MLSVREKDIVEVEVTPGEPGEYGVACRTKDDREEVRSHRHCPPQYVGRR
jgi:hypothetical protein